MKRKYLEHHFQSMLDASFPDRRISKAQEMEMRKTFFAGAMVAINGIAKQGVGIEITQEIVDFSLELAGDMYN